MAPEYGATCGYFAIDEESINYLRLTGRDEEHIAVVEAYLKANDMFFDPTLEPVYTDVVEIDLGDIVANLSGPKRPQDLIPLTDMKVRYRESVVAPQGTQGFGLSEKEFDKTATAKFAEGDVEIPTGAVAIAAITSCTNTSNPYVMLAAGLVAKKAVEKGLTVPAYVKTSLAPGSKVVTGYLEDSGLNVFLDKIGFNTVGYGCTTCIGNSGPLLPEIEKAIIDEDLFVTSVLSGNRNFEGRVHPLVKANYLASPPLVVAYALAGTVDIDLEKDSFGTDKDGNEVFFADIWPSTEEVNEVLSTVVTRELFQKNMHVYLMRTKLGMLLKRQLNLYIHLMTSQHTFKTHHSSKDYLKSLVLSNH